MKTLKIILIALVVGIASLALAIKCEAQTQLAIRVIDATGAPVTGLTDANIKFRISPYGAGNVLAGITVTEVGLQGNYICTGFAAFQLVELWIGGVRQNWFGQQLSGDPNLNFVHLTGNESISGVKTFANGAIMAGTLDMGNQYITNLPDPVDATDAVRKSYLTTHYIIKYGTTPFEGSQSMGNNRLTDVANPTASQDAANKQWVLSQINNIVAPGQGYNMINLIPDADNIGDFDARNWPDAVNLAIGYLALDPDMEMIIDVKGAGITDKYIDVSAPAGYDAFEDRINVRGNQYIFLRLENGASYTVTGGKAIIENLTIYFAATGSNSCSMDGFVFHNCIFRIPNVNNTFTLQNCTFRGNNIFVNDGNLVLNECRGVPVWIRTEGKCSITGATYRINAEFLPTLE